MHTCYLSLQILIYQYTTSSKHLNLKKKYEFGPEFEPFVAKKIRVNAHMSLHIFIYYYILLYIITYLYMIFWGFV